MIERLTKERQQATKTFNSRALTRFMQDVHYKSQNTSEGSRVVNSLTGRIRVVFHNVDRRFKPIEVDSFDHDTINTHLQSSYKKLKKKYPDKYHQKPTVAREDSVMSPGFAPAFTSGHLENYVVKQIKKVGKGKFFTELIAEIKNKDGEFKVVHSEVFD